MDWNKHAKIRILSDFPNLFNQRDNPDRPENLMIHIHGGGFISMSSGSHQNYTRLWAKLMPKTVVCSLDYRLAPESRFPAQLDDCWQAYYWIVLNCEKVFGFNPKKIIMVGDSAGGNLILSLTLMTIERGFRKPDGIVPCYAATLCSEEEFFPSLLFSVDDCILT